MRIKKLNSSYLNFGFPNQFSNEIYFSDFPQGLKDIECTYKSTYSIKHVLSGYEKYLINGKVVTINENEHLIINNENNVSTIPNGIYGKAISIFIDSETLNDVFQNITKSLNYKLSNLEEIKNPLFYEKTYKKDNFRLSRILKQLEAYHYQNIDHINKQIEPTLFFYLSEAIIIDQCNHIKYLNNINSVKKSTTQELYNRVLIGYNYLQDNWNNTFSLKKTANVSMLSPYHFHRVFKETFGLTPMSYHNKIKMEKAFEMLRSNKYSVKEVAFILGYSSSSTFGKAFKKYQYVMPSAIKK